MELQQASNSLSSECKEFITQTESFPIFYFTYFFPDLHMYTCVCYMFVYICRLTLCLRLDFVWKHKKWSSNQYKYRKWKTFWVIQQRPSLYTTTQTTKFINVIVVWAVSDAFKANVPNCWYISKNDQNRFKIDLYSNERATWLSCPVSQIYVTGVCGIHNYHDLLPAVCNNCVMFTCLS